MTSIDVQSVTFVRASKEAVWEALTNPETIQAFHPAGMQIASLPEGGHEIKSPKSGETFIREPLLSKEDGNRLELGFEPSWAPDVDDSSRVVFKLSAEDEACKVTLTQTNCAAFGIGDNWDRFLSSMKSHLETGQGLHIPPSGRN